MDYLIANINWRGNLRVYLQQLENSLLHELAHSKGSPLDNEDLIETLQSTKTKALEIEQFLEDAKSTAAKIEEVCMPDLFSASR